jgi:hypothetical protein
MILMFLVQEYEMNWKRLIFVLLPLAIHLLLGTVLLVIDGVHRNNDKDFSFAVSIMFYYLNWPVCQMLNVMGIELTIMSVMLAGLPVWVGLGAVIWLVGLLFRSRPGSV